MRRFFLFAVLWAALFGPGHVLAACPMASAATHGAHAPCHSEGDTGTDRGSSVRLGHDCCSWLAPSGSSARAFAQKADAPPDDVEANAGPLHLLVFWNAHLLVHPPPLISPPRYLGVVRSGGDTFLRTGRLRL